MEGSLDRSYVPQNCVSVGGCRRCLARQFPTLPQHKCSASNVGDGDPVLSAPVSCVQGGGVLGSGGGAAVPRGGPAQVHGVPVFGLVSGQPLYQAAAMVSSMPSVCWVGASTADRLRPCRGGRNPLGVKEPLWALWNAHTCELSGLHQSQPGHRHERLLVFWDHGTQGMQLMRGLRQPIVFL